MMIHSMKSISLTLYVNHHSQQLSYNVVGYDDSLHEVYFFDSLREDDENQGAPGNRTLSTDYFLSMWDNGVPIFHHVYFTTQKR